jgi:restriction system protein
MGLTLVAAIWIAFNLSTLPIEAWVVLGASLLTLLLLVWQWQQARRAYLTRKRDVADLSPADFERRIGALLQDMGWRNVSRTGGAGDRGVDLRAERDGQRWVVQCKLYTEKNVPPAAVRELVGTLAIQQADRALLVTTSDYSAQAREEARGHPVELWNRDDLLKRLHAAARRRETKTAKYDRLMRRSILYISLIAINAVIVVWAIVSMGGQL